MNVKLVVNKIDWAVIILVCFLVCVSSLFVYFLGNVDVVYCDNLCELGRMGRLESFIK